MIGTTRPAPAHTEQAWWRGDAAKAGALVLLVFAVYSAVWGNGFIWDDDAHLTANPCIIGPLGLREIWTTASANYFPLVLTNLWLQHAIWGLHPLGYHLVNVALHAVSCVLLFGLLKRLEVRAAWWGAAVWALHPVQVESVAWISELKNTQSAVFYLLAIRFYLDWSDSTFKGDRRWRYSAMLVAALAALMSKPSTVMLPVALLLCRWWRERRLSWRDVIPIVPLLALSLSAALWTIWEQRYHSLALGPEWNQTIAERLTIAGKAVCFYLEKLLWPFPVEFVYPRWTPEVTLLGVLTTAAVVVVAGILILRPMATTRPVLFALAYFLALLFPVLGFFNVYYFRYSFVADHFQYLASMAPLALMPAIVAWLPQRSSWNWRPVLGAIVLTGLGIASWLHAREFADSKTLWTATVARNRECWLGETILGNLENEQGHPPAAIEWHRRALRTNPRSHEAHYNLGVALTNSGRFDEATSEYLEALRLKPDYADAEHNLGIALVNAGRPAEAVSHYEKAIRLRPDRAETHVLLGLALTLCSRGDEAVAEYERALKLAPANARAHYAFGRTLEILGRFNDAARQYRDAAALDPRNTDAHTHLAAVLLATGNRIEAMEHLAAAVKLQPDNADLHSDYGSLLLAAGATAQAIAQLREALRLNPQLATAHYNLALALRATGNTKESAQHGAEAHRLKPDLPPAPNQ